MAENVWKLDKVSMQECENFGWILPVHGVAGQGYRMIGMSVLLTVPSENRTCAHTTEAA
jgi:hypothetical protein